MKATEALLADHKMIRKVLDQVTLEHPRLPELMRTLHRIVYAHAWFEDILFLPAIDRSPLLFKRFSDELYQEHKDISELLALLDPRNGPVIPEQKSHLLQLKTLLKSHFDKEEEALFPISEHILDNEGQNELGEEMRKKQMDTIEILRKAGLT